MLEHDDFEIVGEASDGPEVVRLAETLHPDVVVLDMAMPGLNGVSSARDITKVSPQAKVVLLTKFTEERYVLDAIRAGAKGCLARTQAAEHLLPAMREVSAGGVYVSPTVLEYPKSAAIDPLTARERQVLQLIAESKTTKEIAVILGVSVKTADSHRTKIMEKLGIHSTAGLVRYAVRQGLVQP
jgi:DNA-binding NarL/FixJ family response regulator